MFNFSSISFTPDSTTLAIFEEEQVIQSFDLSKTAVKLQVTRSNGQLKADIEVKEVTKLNTSRLEFRTKYDASAVLPSIRVGIANEEVGVNIQGNQIIVEAGKLQLFIIGSDDIRNNRSGGQVFQMEDDIVSIGIDTTDNMLVVRQHDAIKPNV